MSLSPETGDVVDVDEVINSEDSIAVTETGEVGAGHRGLRAWHAESEMVSPGTREISLSPAGMMLGTSPPAKQGGPAGGSPWMRFLQEQTKHPAAGNRFRVNNEEARRTGRNRSSTIVPSRQGKLLRATLRREGRSRDHRTIWRTRQMGTPNPQPVSTRLQKIAELARKAPEMSMTTLSHHIDVEFLKEVYSRIRKDGAPGIDEETAEDYSRDLEENLQSLINRFKSGSYKAPPVKRVHIPKGQGETRPIGIPTFEDRLLQKAVATVMEAVYEQDFLDCSYGFRKGRSPHHAIHELWEKLMGMKGGYVLELDIESYFDTVNHSHLRSFLDQRIRDGDMRKMIDKWLKAGVMEKGNVRFPDSGTPQGSAISPLLSNIYLHEVLDRWFEEVVKPRMKGKAHLIRFADDAVMLFEKGEDARKVMSVIHKRFGKFDLTLHPEKTRLVPFKRPRKGSRKGKEEETGTFDMLGFTWYWGLSRRKNWVVKRSTMKKRLNRFLKGINVWCKKHRHCEVAWQHKKLKSKVLGHFAYFGVPGNHHSLRTVHEVVKEMWFKWLKRRSQKNGMNWERFNKLLKRYPIPEPDMKKMPYRRVAKL